MAAADRNRARLRAGSEGSIKYTRWWIAAPGEDESIRSVVGRACEQYRWVGSFGDRLTQRRCTMPERRSLENCGARDIRALADRLGMAPRTLFAHRTVDEAGFVCAPGYGVYCPRCWQCADRGGRPRTFRRACQSLFQLSCPVHPTVPLRQAILTLRQRQPVGNERRPTARARECLEWVDHFAARLRACLFDRAPWPAHWCGDANAAKVLLSACVSNLTDTRGYSLLHNVMVPVHLSMWLARPSGRLEPLRGDAWSALREILDPKARRLAFWFIGWLTVSDMPIDLWPEPYAGQIAYSSVHVFQERALPKRWAQAALGILDAAVLQRERQRLAWEQSGTIPWGGGRSVWKKPVRPRRPRRAP